MSQEIIRFAGPDDSDAVAAVIRELDRHYRPRDELMPPTEYRRRLREVIESNEGTRFVLAFDDVAHPVGIACIVILRPGRDLGGLLYLKDLYVSDAARGAGLGTRILQFLANFAIDRGIDRMDLTTDSDNAGAQRFYDSLGGVVREKVLYTIHNDALAALAKGDGRKI